MQSQKRVLSSVVLIAVALVMVIGLTAFMTGQEAPGQQPTGWVDDWTHHRLVFSNPGTEQDAINNRTYDRWYTITHDPRYQLQQLKRSHPQQAVAPALSATPADFASRLATAMASKPEPILPPTPIPMPKRNPIKKDWSTTLGAASATQTGTFTASSGTGTVTVNGTPNLTASPGTAASQSTTISTNGAGDGSTITITNPLVGSPLVLTASTPVAEIDEIAFGSTPSSNSYVTITGVNYEFKTSNWSGTVTSGYCFIRTSITTSTMVSELDSAVTSGSANGGTSSTSTWQCGTSATQSATTGVSVSSTTSSAVYVQANTPGATGFTAPSNNGTTHLTITHNSTTGTNGSSVSPFFQWWSGAGPAPAATLATNIYNAIGSANAVGVGATNPSSGQVVITATLTGLAGRSINVATSISSGLTGGGFNGNLSGGTSGTTSGTTFSTSTDDYTSQANNLANEAAALASAINTNVSAVTATATGATVEVIDKTAGSGGNSITLSQALSTGFSWAGGNLAGGGASAVQPNAYPAKYGASLTTASCNNDFVVYPTGAVGTAGEASIVAYNNMYTTGCTGTVPSVYWAYNTGGTVTTSPILSYWDNAAQVAFIQSNGKTASLVLIKWAAETGELVTSPLTLTNSSSGTAYRSCSPTAAAPCMYTMAFANSANDTYSSPFYDYADDILWVGDDSGNLHRFTGVFGGSPAESGSPWPVTLTSGTKVSSPVYDLNFGYVEVGDFGGFFYFVTASSGAVQKDGSYGDVIADAPVVDGSRGETMAFVTTGGTSFGNGNNSVVEFDTEYGVPTADSGFVSVGTGGAGYYLYAGSYDNVYYETTTRNVTGEGGNLYVLGNTGATSGATLYQVTMTGNAYNSQSWISGVNAVVTGLTPSGAYPWPSPLTEFCNNGTSACALNPQRTVTGTLKTSSAEVALTGGYTFTSADVGSVITAPAGIPAGDTIATVLSSTTANLTTAPTANEGSQTLTISGQNSTTAGTDYVFFSLNRAGVGGCTNTAGHGCVLAYNVSNPSSVSISNSGLPVTTPGTNGCWATGGLIIDNSDTTKTGAQQIYFVGLNGAAAGGPTGATSSNCTAGSATLNATQAQQSNP